MLRSTSRGRERTRSRTPDSRSPSRHPSLSPRSARRGGRTPSPHRDRSSSPRDRSTKVVVEKLTKNIREEHLREIFGVYGQIRDMDMPMNRQFNTNRGTAYILYALESDAENAIAHMHESQIDGSIIHVSIVLPRRKFSPPPPLARRGANIDPRGPPSASFRGPPRRRSPPPAARGYRERPNFDTYRPRSHSRSRSPRRRSRSRSYSSRSRSPPRRRGGRRESLGRNNGRRSPSYSSYSSYDDRSRSRSRSPRRGGRGRR